MKMATAATTLDGENKVLVTAKRIVKSLGNTSNTDGMLLILSNIDNRLSSLSSFLTSGKKPSAPAKSSPVDLRLDAAERMVLNDADLPSLDLYLCAVDDVVRLMEELDLDPDDDGVTDRAENMLQFAMARLEGEFRNVLIQKTVPLDAESLHRSLLSSSAAAIAIAATEFLNDETDEKGLEDVSSGRYSHHCRAKGISFGGDGMSLELISEDALSDLCEIANRMIQSGYEKECCQVYCAARRDVLDECLAILGVQKLSIEEVHRIEWESLDENMKKWIQAVKVVVRGLLSSEKYLCEQIFCASDLIKEVCFLEISKGCVMQLLNFGEAIAMGKRSVEKLFRILDMHDVLAQVLPDLQVLFMDEGSGEIMCSEAKGILNLLSEAAVGTFVQFENAVQGEASRKLIPNGDIHPLARYVMNYSMLLVDYSDTLNLLLGNEVVESATVEKESTDSSEEDEISPIGRRLLALIASLEANIEEKSEMCPDAAIQCIFLMNNIHYVVQKVKDSDLRNLLGDNWIKKRRSLIRQYATHYLREAWTIALSCFKDEGIGGTSSSTSKVSLKERFKNFNACFEDIYRIQTAWKVPNPQLRDELRISISEKVIPAYRSFLGRFHSQLDSGRRTGKYIKYTAEDLENYLLDLFEGTPLILHHMRRKGS